MTSDHRGRRVLVRMLQGLAVVVSLATVVAVTGTYLLYNRISDNIHHVDVSSAVGPVPTKAPTATHAENFLIMGSDTRAGPGDAQYGRDIVGARSDTTLLVHISADQQHAVIVSIPRDSYVEIPACRVTGSHTSGLSTPHLDKFNAAFSIGGAACTIKLVQQLTHVPIDHYIVIDFAGFKRMVDALGGVPICVAHPISDPIVHTSAGWHGSGLNLPAGHVVLHGEQALALMRARYAIGDGSDLGRIKNQQRFISAVIRKVTSTGTAMDLPRLISFLDAASKSLTTDPGLGAAEFEKLATALRGLGAGHVQLLTVPLADATTAAAHGVPSADVMWDPAAATALWQAIRADRSITARPKKTTTTAALTVPPNRIALHVENGTSTAGLAHRASSDLAGEGFLIASVGNASTSGSTRSVVRYGAGRADSARTVAAAIPGSTLQLDNSVGDTVVVVIGSNYAGAKPVSVSSTTSTAPATTHKLEIKTAANAGCVQ